ncbi:MAG: histidine kinase dimerization/phospho-acceptor domain-containing protein [Candidatus Methylomirabilales bacterium]
MNDTLRTVVQAFQIMAEGYQLLATRLGREFDQVQSDHAELKEYAQRLEANAKQLASHTQHLSASVAELTARASELEAEKEVLAEQVQDKTGLLDTLAQEVRPPLIALKGAVTLLREEPVDPEDRRAFLALANENVVELLHLIDRCLPLGTGWKGTASSRSPEE